MAVSKKKVSKVKVALPESITKENVRKSKYFTQNNHLLVIILGVVVLAGIATAAFFFVGYKQKKVDPVQAAQAEGESLVATVGKLIVLPQNEKPTIATVSDVNKLKGQDFFNDAKNGDKVLMYPNAKKAILYDPEKNKIVNLGPININQNSPAASVAAASIAPESIHVAIYNGTNISGYSAKIADQLKSSLPQIKVTEKTNAQKNTYTKTEIIDLTGKQTSQVPALVEQLQGEVASMPDNETKPQDADILIILGSSQ